MFVKNLLDCEEFLAGDRTRLRELLHPAKQPLDLRYSLAHAIVEVGDTSLLHALKTSEVYYILQGTGEMHIDEEARIVTEGDAIYISPNARQYIHNYGDKPLIVPCIVDPAWRGSDEIVFE